MVNLITGMVNMEAVLRQCGKMEAVWRQCEE